MMRRRQHTVRKNHAVKHPARRRRVKKKSFRQKIVRWAMVMVLAAISIVGLWEFERLESVAMNWTTIQQVSIVGLTKLERKEVLSELALSPETSLLQIQPESMMTHLEAHPWIRQVSIERVFPHTLAIRIVEREPAAIWESSKRKYLLDEEAYVLSKLEDPHLPRLPIVKGLSSNFSNSDDQDLRRHVHHGIQVGTLLSRAFNTVPTVNVNRASVIVADVQELRFQFADSIEEQWQRFQALYPSIRTQISSEATEVDLRYAGKVIIRKRE